MTPAPTLLRPRRAGALLVTVLLAVTALVAITPTTAAAASGTMTFDGRGWGHGRGMSQYGAQGYAKNHGWTSGQILNHYYGGTHKGLAGDAVRNSGDPRFDFMRIRLLRMSGKQTRVSITNGSLKITHSGSLSLPANTRSVVLNKVGSQFEVWASTSSSCTVGLTRIGDTNSSLVDIGKTVGDNQTANDLIRVCPPSAGGTTYWYPGSIRGQIVNGRTETMNITTIDKQLRSVVPSESPASWLPAALQAQAVAARSYALAGDTRWPGADTCDTISCQVYNGWFTGPEGSPSAATHPNTDAAISATANQVRLTGSNRIARTEFSSTSGGWTAGGTFPAVQDLGDSISPLHTWTRTVSTAPLESAYGGGSTLTAVEVTKRNGLGAMGGRVLEARLRFSNGITKLTTGNDIRSRLGLLSDWFSPTCATEGAYIQATHKLFLGRSASSNEVAFWCGTVRSGNRSTLTHALSVSDEWAGVQIAALYEKILGRPADGPGRAYWLDRVRAGYRIEDIAAYFYGGDEYFTRAGRTNPGFVDRLYRDLLGRPPDSGRSYWIGQLDSGRLSRSGVAANFYASIESRESRVDALYRQILGRGADAGGLSYWSGELLHLGEVSLAAYLAASREYYDRVT